MFDIKGLRTFAMSAKDLNKSVEFYTKTLAVRLLAGSSRRKNS